MLAEGTLDVVLENTQMPAALLESQPYGRDYMVLAVPRSWPINAQLRAWQLSIENICSGKFLIPASVIGGFLGLLIGLVVRKPFVGVTHFIEEDMERTGVL